MPIYEYECRRCGQFEVIQKITEEPLKTCEKCGRKVHRLMSLSSFALVGGGWYKDLYSSTGNKAGSASDSGPTASGSSSPPSSAASKPAPSSTPSTSTSKPAPSSTSNSAKSEGKSDKSSTAAA